MSKQTNVLIFLIASLLSSCLKDEPIQVLFEDFSADSIGDGWMISDPGSENMDSLILNELFESILTEALYPNLKSVLVARNGKLVAEVYFKSPGDRNRIHAIMSVTKSITSLVTGIAFDQGWLDSLDATLSSYFPEYCANELIKQNITIRQLLTMETGLDYDNDIHTNEMIHSGGSSLEYILSRPMAFPPGTDWYYGDGNPQVISGIITRVTDLTMEEIAHEFLFEPLGISDYFWENHDDGLSLGGMGLWMKPRDMAKIGQLMLNEGSWEGEQLISTEWIQASTKRQAIYRDYGYYWLTGDNNTFWASGKGGQIIWIYPDKSLVVVVTSDSYARSWILSNGSYDIIFQKVYDSILD